MFNVIYNDGFYKWLLLVCVLTMSLGLGAQSEQTTQQQVDLRSDVKKEEVQRYFGYEDLLYRYLTVPFDLNQNVNQKGRHVDFGFALLALLPLLFLRLVYHRKWLFYGMSGLLIIYLFMSFFFSEIASNDRVVLYPSDAEWSEKVAAAQFSNKVIPSLYKASVSLSKPIRSIIDNFTGQSDHVTYPIIISLFLLGLSFIVRRVGKSPKIGTVGVVFIVYFFFWWILAGGIVWYGFLVLPLGFILLVYKHGKSNISVFQFSSHFSIGVMVLWLFIAYIGRISYINPLQPITSEYSGFMIEDPITMLYATGARSAKETIDIAAPNVGKALSRINSDYRKIYQVGTSLSFDIKYDHLRITEDNLLGLFAELIIPHNTQSKFTNKLKEWGFGYILIDLNTPGLDRTPEKSLVKKYQTLLALVLNNPQMQLVATDRKVFDNSTGQERFGVFGDRITHQGSYAVYEIF